MSELDQIRSTLANAVWRRRWQKAWAGLWLGLLAGSVGWLLVYSLYKVAPVPEFALAAAGALGVAGALAGFVIGAYPNVTLVQMARWMDGREKLQERLATALELSDSDAPGQWKGLVLGDAVTHLARVRVARLLPFRLPKTSRWVLLTLALAAGLGFVPEYRSPAYLQKKKDQDSVREAGRNLSELARRTLERRKPALETTRQTLKSVQDLGIQLDRNPTTRTEALRELARMTDKVKDDARELARQPGVKSLEQASRSQGDKEPADSGELQKQIDALRKALGDKPGDPDAIEKLQEQLQKARQAAAQMQSKGSEASDAARDSLSKALSDLARQAQDLGAALPALEEAIAALQAGKIGQVLSSLKAAERDLEKLKEMAEALQRMQQDATKAGKDLAEQLENGQAEAAQETLRKMISQLRSGQMSKEQADAMMSEVRKAIKPAAPYGKVPDHLREAVKQMEAGQNGAAAQALSDAAKELGNMMEQMADAQDLKSTIEALKRAQLAVGSGNSWGNSKGPPRAGKGGKPGRGVGTWADESDWTDQPEQTDRWDNSGVQRPDTDPRGLTDRGQGQTPDGMEATSVKGQFSPGSQMPSITLRGVSIKGKSSVDLKAVVTAAQSEAQSAIANDQVPRGYQSAVKDYFNDLNDEH